MRLFSRPSTQAFEGVGIAFDAIRANKVRAALTIMGVALGVFVVVAMSSVVRGINESFRRDLEAAGPTSFFVYRRPIGGFSACDGRRDLPRAPQSRRSRSTRCAASSGCRRSAPSRRTSAMARQFKYKDQVARAPAWRSTRRTGPTSTAATSIPAAASRTRRTQTARSVVLVNDKLAEQLFGDSDPLDKDDQDRRRRVHGDRPLSLHGEPDGHADVGRRRRFAEGDRAARDRPPPPEPLDARQQSDREAARRRRGRGSGRRRDRRTARRIAGCARAQPNNFDDRHAGPAAGRSTTSCSARSSSSASRCRRSGCSSAASA